MRAGLDAWPPPWVPEPAKGYGTAGEAPPSPLTGTHAGFVRAHEDGGHELLVRDRQMVFTCSGPTSFALLPLVSGNNAGAAARSKIGLSKWDILAFKCTTRMGVFALILSSLSLRRERMEKTGMFSRGVKPGPGLLRLDWGWEVLDAVLGCQCSIPQHPAAQTME